MKADPALQTLQRVHGTAVFARRVRVLTSALVEALPRNVSVLDVGCGDGSIDANVMEQRPDVKIVGIDTRVRPSTKIPATEYDGVHIPHPDKSFDVVMMIDVLHHTPDPTVVLREASRVARSAIVIKDHVKAGLAAGPTLRFMDWVGNRAHGVDLPYNYWTERQWNDAFVMIGLKVARRVDHLGLYPFYARPLFEWGLHLLVTLTPPQHG